MGEETFGKPMAGFRMARKHPPRGVFQRADDAGIWSRKRPAGPTVGWTLPGGGAAGRGCFGEAGGDGSVAVGGGRGKWTVMFFCRILCFWVLLADFADFAWDSVVRLFGCSGREVSRDGHPIRGRAIPSGGGLVRSPSSLVAFAKSRRLFHAILRKTHFSYGKPDWV